MKADEIYEAPMNPSNFAAAIEQGQSKGVLVGYEFEVCVPRKTIAQAKKMPKPEIDYVKRIEYVLDEEGDPFDENDVLDIPLSTMEKFIKPKSNVARYKSYAEALNVIFQKRLPEVKSLFEQVPKPTRLKAIPLAQEKVKEMKLRWNNQNSNFFKNYPEELLFTFQFGRAVNAVTTGYKYEELANDIRWQSQISYSEIFEEMFGEARDTIYNNLTNYFDFDPKKLYNLLFSDYDYVDDDDEYSYDDSDYDYSGAVKALYPAITKAFGQTHIYKEYHEGIKNMTDWYIEPDGSLIPNGNDGAAEVVSPPMPAKDSIAALKKFYAVAKQLGLYTSKKNKTGLHINVSIPQELDVLKLAVFLGDQHVLQQFGRQQNRYSASVTRDMSDALRGSVIRRRDKPEPDRLPFVQKQTLTKDPFGRQGVQTSLNYPMLKRLIGNISNEHFASINYNGKYVSFRHAGGNYLEHPDQVINVVGRFIRAMIIASDPNAYQEEYKSKLAKMTISSTSNVTIGATPAQEFKSVIDYVKTNGVPLLMFDIMKFKPNAKPQSLVIHAMDSIDLPFGQQSTEYQLNSPQAKANLLAKLVNPELKAKVNATDPSMFFTAFTTLRPEVMGVLIRTKLEPGVNYIQNPADYTENNIGLVYAYKTHVPVTSGMGQQILRAMNIQYAKVLKKEKQLEKRREADRQRRLAKKASAAPAPTITEAGEVPTYYFAYGMLTDPRIMNGVELVGKATLENFTLEMLHFANVVSTKGGRVFGSLWQVDRQLISQLDRIEGYPHLYDRKTVPVTANGQRYVAEIYTMTPQTREDMQGHPPTQDYINKIARGYKNAGIPIQQLKNALK